MFSNRAVRPAGAKAYSLTLPVLPTCFRDGSNKLPRACQRPRAAYVNSKRIRAYVHTHVSFKDDSDSSALTWYRSAGCLDSMLQPQMSRHHHDFACVLLCTTSSIATTGEATHETETGVSVSLSRSTRCTGLRFVVLPQQQAWPAQLHICRHVELHARGRQVMHVT